MDSVLRSIFAGGGTADFFFWRGGHWEKKLKNGKIFL